MNNGGYEAEMTNEVKRSDKKRFRIVDFIAYVICLALALGIWIYVIGTETEEFEYTFTNVAVKVEGASELERRHGLAVMKDYQTTVNITVKGYRSEIMKYTSEDIFAYVNVGSISETGIHSINIMTEMPIGKLNVVSVSPAAVNVFIDESATKNVPLEIDLHYNVADAYTIHDPVPEFETVEIRGPKTALDNVSRAKVVYDLGTVTTSTNFRAPIKLYDEDNNEVVNPYVKSAVGETAVKVKVTTEKLLTLVPSFSANDTDKFDYNVILTPGAVTVVGDPATVGSLETAQVMLGELSQSIKGSITAGSAIRLPEGVTFKDAELIKYEIIKTPKPADPEDDA